MTNHSVEAHRAAHDLLDRARDGVPVSAELIAHALHVTGDLPISRRVIVQNRDYENKEQDHG